jgi:pimeloyl-ACP methyl ester carboxylesterase
MWSLLEPARAVAEFGTLPFAALFLGQAPRGDGHPVMVLPGFLASDRSTSVLRAYLSALGYAVHPWALGRNVGRGGDIERLMIERAGQLASLHGRKVSLIGWSLGGIFARDISREIPGSIRQVITLGSPIGSGGRGGTNSEISHLYESLTGDLFNYAPGHVHAARRRSPPVPATAIYSRTDGVAVWQVCVEEEGPRTDNIEVHGSHSGLGFNPMVLYAVADRLAQPEDKWMPFDRSGFRGFFYG